MEWALLAAIGAGAVHAGVRLATDGYLPQPFLYNPNDTFMDWYYTAYWANEGGAYQVWHAIYPPLSFAWARLFSTPACYGVADLWVRDCDPIGPAMLAILWAANGALAWMAFRRHDPATALPRAMALAFGLPALFAVERGNLITPALTFFAMAWGGLLKPGVPTALAHAMVLNFKPYMVPALLGFVPRRRWAVLVLIAWAVLLVYVATWGVAGGSPGEIHANLGIWANLGHRFPVSEIYQTTSFNAFAGVLARGVPAGQWSGPGLGKVIALGKAVLGVALVVQLVVQALVVAALAAAWRWPRGLGEARVALLALLLAFTISSPGGYALVFPLFLLFLERDRSAPMTVALVCGYLLSIPWDWVIVAYPETMTPSWLTGRTVAAHFGLAAGQLVRPGLLLALAAALAVDSLARIRQAADHD